MFTNHINKNAVVILNNDYQKHGSSNKLINNNNNKYYNILYFIFHIHFYKCIYIDLIEFIDNEYNSNIDNI